MNGRVCALCVHRTLPSRLCVWVLSQLASHKSQCLYLIITAWKSTQYKACYWADCTTKIIPLDDLLFISVSVREYPLWTVTYSTADEPSHFKHSRHRPVIRILCLSTTSYYGQLDQMHGTCAVYTYAAMIWHQRKFKRTLSHFSPKVWAREYL